MQRCLREESQGQPGIGQERRPKTCRSGGTSERIGSPPRNHLAIIRTDSGFTPVPPQCPADAAKAEGQLIVTSTANVTIPSLGR